MATKPEEPQPEPSRPQRLVSAVKHEVADKNVRAVSLLAISAGLASFAPTPFDGVIAASMVLLAADRGRR